MMETFQGLFVPLGFSRKAAAGLSEAMVKLSMDVGSFRDVDPTQVAQMFTSALIGNHEAVRRLNIALTENSVKNAAVLNGFALSKNAVTDQAKVLGRFAEIMRQTTDAQGDMSRTMDDFNNRARRVQQQMIELRQTFGENLLPLAEFGLSFAEVAFKADILKGALVGLVGAYVGVKLGAIAATIATIGFKTALLGTKAGATALIATTTAVTTAIGFFISRNKDLDAVTKDVSGRLHDQHQSGIQAQKSLAKLNHEAQRTFHHYIGISESATQATNSTETLAEKKQRLQILITQLNKDLNLEAETLKAVAKRTSELNEVNIKRIKALQTEILLMDQSSALIKAMVSARINENRELTKNEITLLRHIDNLNLEKQAMKQANTQIEERISNLKKLQTQVKNIRDENAAMFLEQITGDEKLRELETIRTDLLNNFENAYKSAFGTATGEAFFDNLQLNKKSLSELLTMDMSSFGLLGPQLEAFQVNAGLTAEQVLKVNENFKTTEMTANITAAAIVGVAGAMKTLGDNSASTGQKMSAVLSTLGSILMMVPGMQIPGAAATAASMFVGHTGGLIKNNGIQKFAQGGMVRGQDNVPIMAQAGEFIMRRDAVQNIGVNNLAEMNRTGSGGGVTVNIQGNMVGNESFVRDTLIPEITRAQRQNLA